MDASTLNYYMNYYDSWAGLPRGTLMAVAKTESSYNPSTGDFKNVCNWIGACGLMQLRKNALADIQKIYGISLNPLDPIQAIVGAAGLFRINRMYLQHYSGMAPDLWALVASYNGGFQQGLRYMKRQVLAAETNKYLYSIYNNMA